MTSVIGALRVNLGLDSAQFIRGTQQAQGSMDRMATRMKAAGAALAASVGAAFLAIGKASIDGAVAQRQAVAQVEAALTSMGNVAGRTSQQLVAAADAMELRSLFDADVILKQVTANLLTFGNIAGEQFDRAQQAAIDMAARLGGEPQAAAIALGKALNDPIAGITALTRVGVQFTEQQKEQIEAMVAAGDTAAAQGLILTELEKQFGGAAAAAAANDPYRAFQVILGQIGDIIGEALLPSLFKFSDFLVENREEILRSAQRVGDFISAMIDLGNKVASVAAWVEERFGAIHRAVSFIINPLQTALSLLRGFGFIGGGGGSGSVSNNPAANALRGVTAQSNAATRSFASLGSSASGAGSRLSGGFGGGARAASVGLSAAAREAENLERKVNALFDRLFPKLAEARRLTEELALLDGSGRSEEEIRLARLRRLQEGQGDATVSEGLLGTGQLEEVNRVSDHYETVLAQLADTSKTQTVRIAQSFAEMTRGVLSSLQGLTNSIRSGDVLGILEGVLGIFTQIGSAGGFGGGIQSFLNRPIPGFANGTKYAPGGLAVVGERGPELVSLNRGAQVIPNRALGGSMVEVIPSPYFDIVVDGRIIRAAPGVANAGAQQAQVLAAKSARRRVR